MPDFPPFSFPISSSTYRQCKIDCQEHMDPLRAFLSRNDNRNYSRRIFLSPLLLAAARGETEVVRFLQQYFENPQERESDEALFLANRQGHTTTAALLLELNANPGKESSQNGMHGAAWRGLNEQIKEYVTKHKAEADVRDGASATPVVYAILGIQDEQDAWETMKSLFELGANPLLRFGTDKLSYAEIAEGEGKVYLAEKLEGLCHSPTITNSSRESTCTLGRDSDQPDNKRLQETTGAGGGAILSLQANQGNYVETDNKRPQEWDVDARAKRARTA
ncbi:unnamed protein product [Fusarium fujikuroi]|nr:Uncharacterized protein Y057_14515 [Fusarium fujikuroi]SCN98205.1 uncharacterized protein FFE2_08911 [Fusarium fujikuroi]SCO07053.1 uncharacterized protein FFC1_10299 [Fusarium fujikuroi]SCO44744.1 uncharacterized protein FFNC_10014 [Fusarium fujikuroi]VZI03672.1 unnamed protein product [Fusarium fujikuroi]